ncbi:MAG: hydrogenase maturation protease [Chloroflexia bacterium]
MKEERTRRPATVVIAIGNPILRDDGVGFYVAEDLRGRLNERRVEVVRACAGGFRLLDALAGRRRAVLVDALRLGGKPGQVYLLSAEDLQGRIRAATPHEAGLPEALALGQQLGMEMPEVVVVGIEPAEVEEFGEGLTPEVAAAVPEAVALVLAEAEPDLAAAVREQTVEGRLPCAAAFRLARKWHLSPRQAAEFAAGLGVRLGWCQLGLFAGPKKGDRPPPEVEAVSPALRQAVEEGLEEGRLPCARAWAIAKRLHLERLAVGRAAEALGIRISRCQLGCF